MKTIVLTHRAAKDLDSISEPMRCRINDAMSDYAMTGRGDTKALAGSSDIRMRVGDYPVLFGESGDEIVVERVGHRREIYR